LTKPAARASQHDTKKLFVQCPIKCACARSPRDSSVCRLQRIESRRIRL
jgi:hypothetical protein